MTQALSQATEADERFEALARESADRLTELGIERRRDLEDAGIRQGRRTDDANIRQERGVGDINAQATATATAIQEALTPLLEQQQTGEVEVAEKQIEAADAQTTAAEQTESAATNLGTVATALNDSDIPGVIDLARQSAEASLGISSAILALPGLLETSFEKIFDDLQETIVDILRIEEGISGGVGQFLLDTLIDSEGTVTGIVGQTAAFALQALGINPDQFAPPEPVVDEGLQEMLSQTDGALDVNVVNSGDIYDPAEIERLSGEGFNNREIGQILRDAVLPAAEPLADMMTFAAPVPEPIQTLDGVVGGGVVNVRVTNLSELSGALGAGGDGSGTTQINPTFILQLDDGSMTAVESRIAVRSDQGLSPLNV